MRKCIPMWFLCRISRGEVSPCGEEVTLVWHHEVYKNTACMVLCSDNSCVAQLAIHSPGHC